MNDNNKKYRAEGYPQMSPMYHCHHKQSHSGNRGFLLGLVAVLVPIMIVMVVAYQSHVRQEALRAHRVYWNDLVTKSAEGVAEEAFRWLIDNPADPANLIFARLRQPPAAAAPTTVTMTLSEAQLPFIAELRASYDGIDVIKRVTLTLSGIKPLFTPVTVPPAGFDPRTQGQIYPDPTDVFGLLKAEIEADYRGFKRKFVVVRDLKAINILPGVFGQFTLFVKEKKNGYDYDWNKLRNSSRVSPPFLDSFGFIQPEANAMNNPVTLIHHPDDVIRTCSPSEIPEDSVAPPIPADWASIDLTRRGWAYFGRSQDSGPLQYYIYQPMHGDVKIAANHPTLPAAFQGRPHLFYGGTYMLSDRSKLYYLLRDDSPTSPAWTNFFPNSGGINLPAAGLVDASGTPLVGWIAWQSRFGLMSMTRPVLESFAFYDLLKSYYEHPQHQVGDTSGSLETAHASLILPMGDMFPLGSSQIADRRSPTVVLGAWLRFLQVGNIVQVDDDIKTALAETPPGDWLKRLNSPANLVQPITYYFPFFPINVNRQVSPPAVSFDLANDKLGWANYPVWGKVDDSTAADTADFARVAYNVFTHIFQKIGNPQEVYEIVMTKMLVYPAMMIYEQMLNDNMRGLPISLFVPGGAAPTDPALKLKNMPAGLAAVLHGADSSSGAPVSGSVADFGESFFYKNPDSAQNGRGITGECVSIKDTAGRQLALGSLGVLWPFSPDYAMTSPLATPGAVRGYDLRQKTTFLASSSQVFAESFLVEENGKTCLDLRGGVVTVLNDTIRLSAGVGNEIVCRNGGILIASGGEILLESSIRMLNPDDTLVIATAREGKDIKLKPGIFNVYLISSGTIRRLAPGAIKISGGVAVNHLDFRDNSSSLFHGYPNSTDARQAIIWDESFNVLDPDRFAAGIRVHLGKSLVYWADEKADMP